MNDREKAAQNAQMFGCSQLMLIEAAENYNGTKLDLAMSLLSDVQELMEMGMLTQAQKITNRAKWMIDTYQRPLPIEEARARRTT